MLNRPLSKVGHQSNIQTYFYLFIYFILFYLSIYLFFGKKETRSGEKFNKIFIVFTSVNNVLIILTPVDNNAQPEWGVVIEMRGPSVDILLVENLSILARRKVKFNSVFQNVVLNFIILKSLSSFFSFSESTIDNCSWKRVRACVRACLKFITIESELEVLLMRYIYI